MAIVTETELEKQMDVRKCMQCGSEFTPAVDRGIWCDKCNDTFMQEAIGLGERRGGFNFPIVVLP